MFRLPVDADVVNEAKRNSELQVTDESRSPIDDLAWASSRRESGHLLGRGLTMTGIATAFDLGRNMGRRTASRDLEIPIDHMNECALSGPVADVVPSFEQIVDAHYASLYRFALSMCHQQATALDLVQHTFLQWARKGDTLRDKSKIKTWLFTTLYREWLGIARKEQRHEAVEFDPERHGEAAEDVGEPPVVDSAILQKALEEMDPSYRAPVVLFYLKELSYKEIADILEVPIGTVMSRLSRGKNALRKILLRHPDVAREGRAA